VPFHRRLLCSSDTLKILKPEHFINPKDNIKVKGMEVRIKLFRHSFVSSDLYFEDVCVPCFVPHMCYNVECEGSMLLILNLQESIVVVNESGNTYVNTSCTIKYSNPLKHFKSRFLMKAAAFVWESAKIVWLMATSTSIHPTHPKRTLVLGYLGYRARLALSVFSLSWAHKKWGGGFVSEWEWHF
jgi:hypothetical protein